MFLSSLFPTWRCGAQRLRRCRARLLLGLALLPALLTGGVPAWAEDAARVLFINSYHRGYAWSDGIEQGLRQRLEASASRIEISYEYLDSLRFAYNAQIEPLADSMAIKYARYRPNLVVVADNAAFDFAIQHRDQLFPGLSIVFCGFNNFRPENIRGMAGITGVNEEINLPGGVDMALKVHPATRNLVFVTSTEDVSSRHNSELAEKNLFAKYRQAYNLVLLKDASLEEVSARLGRLPRDSLVFIVGQLRQTDGGRALPPEETARLIAAASPVPVYSFWDFHLGTGIMGGQILSGPEQGRAAADLALRVLAGTPASAIPVIMASPTSNIFDYQVMQRFGISAGALPADSTIVNQSIKLWDAYRGQIVGVIVVLVLETLLIGVLVRSMRGRRAALAELARERALLERRVDERTMELREANQQLARLSYCDGLTQLANRRRFDQVLQTEFQRLRRSGAPLSLIMLDVDLFKNYNDSLGHVAGDDCLKQVAGLISRLTHRPTDLAARYGGEEFAVILPETPASGAINLAERIRAGIADLAIPHLASTVAAHVTASLGLVTVQPRDMKSWMEVVHLADQQLYQAKSAGRNRVFAGNLL